MDREATEGAGDARLSVFLEEISAGGDDYRRLVERLPTIVYAAEAGENGRWRYVSPQIEEILGYAPEEWLADPGLWSRQIHPEDRERALEQDGRDGRDPNGGFPPVDYRMRTRDGRVVWFLDEAVLEPDHNGTPIWHGVLYDITDRKQVEADLRRAAAQQAAVARLGRRALQDGEPGKLREAAVGLMTEIEGVDAACIWGSSHETRGLTLWAGLERRAGGGERRATASLDSHAGAALDSGLHVIVDEWSAEPRFELPAAPRALGVRSSLAVPIAGKERQFGVLDLHSLEPSRFTPQDVHFAQASANVLADALERHAADAALRHRVMHDPLTGLPNRLNFVDVLERALEEPREGGPVGFIYLDLDHFKLINDSIGHHAGDQLLRAVAPRLRAQLRPGDVVARFGGDEFGVLIDGLADEEEALTIADRVSGAFLDPYEINGAEHFVTASVGIAVARRGDGEPADAERLIRDADAAMYRAKERGRGRCEVFDAEMRASARYRQEIERDLRHALDREELELRYQPLVSLRSGEIDGVEALLRWRHPQRGTLEPGGFVPVAEDSGLIEAIGSWVQETACRQAVAWHDMRPDRRPLDIAVNLSARQVAHRDLPAGVREILDRTGLDPASLRLEITESVLVEESATAAATLEALSELGVGLVLDDFGTGYSSLAYLNRFPFDALKIDRSFVEGLGAEEERTAIVEAVVGMARALSLDVIAEGVESQTQLAELRRLRCDYAQGHLFSRPLEAERITALLREGGGSGLLGDLAR